MFPSSTNGWVFVTLCFWYDHWGAKNNGDYLLSHPKSFPRTWPRFSKENHLCFCTCTSLLAACVRTICISATDEASRKCYPCCILEQHYSCTFSHMATHTKLGWEHSIASCKQAWIHLLEKLVITKITNFNVRKKSFLTLGISKQGRALRFTCSSSFIGDVGKWLLESNHQAASKAEKEMKGARR